MEHEDEQLEFDFENATAKIYRESRDEIRLSIGEFAGPLDLLLFLIRREQANIFDIPVARITDEYLNYIKMMEKLDIAVAGEFLVMAAQLIEIKSRMLLPQDPKAADEEELEDPRQELVDRLLEHQKYKNAAEMLWSRATVEQAVYTRGRLDTDDNNMEVSATVFDLFEQFQKILERKKDEILMDIKREEMSLADMIRTMRERLRSHKRLNLMELFSTLETRRELVLAFVATLEIVRTSAVKLTQKSTFADIHLVIDEV
ncbi:MAG: segregation/condensation protein A [Pyrinomonadaceae bacterium]